MEPPKPNQPAHCTFCELIRGSAEVSICHEDADAIAFMDIQPVNNGHVLVVPRAHYESLLDVPEALGLHLFKVTMRLANAVRSVTGCNDLNIVVNSGAAAGQDEPHYHVHIIPRREGDGFDIPLPFNGSQMPDRTVLDAFAVRIISALRDPVRAEASAPSATEPSSDVQRSTTDRSAQRGIDAAANSEPTGSGAPNSARPPEERKNDRWGVEEGAHGELVYERRLKNRDGT